MMREPTRDPPHSPVSWVLLVLGLWAAGDQIVRALSWGHENWALTDCLINYSGGFVRRGLLGSILMSASDLLGIPINHLAIGLCVLVFISLAIYLVRKAGPHFSSAVLLSCLALGFPAFQDGMIRKDCLGLLLLCGCLEVARSKLPSPAKFLGGNLLAAFAILSHETFAFYALPGLILFHARSPREIALATLKWSPAIFCFALAVNFHGSPEIAQHIHDSLLPLWQTVEPSGSSLGTPSGSIGAIGWTSEQGLGPGINLLTSGWYQPSAWAFLFGTTFLLLIHFVGGGQDRQTQTKARLECSSILVTQFVFIAPLFVLGHDYGRWLFFWSVSSMILFSNGFRSPEWVSATVRTLAGKTQALWKHLSTIPRLEAILLIVGVPSAWNLHEFLNASPLAFAINIIKTWV